MSDKVFAKGMYVKQAKPSFIVCKIGFKVDDFIEFLKSNRKDNGYVDVDILTKKDSEDMYAELNTWTPDGSKSQPPEENEPEDTPF